MQRNEGKSGPRPDQLRQLMELFQPGRDSWEDPVFAPLRQALDLNPELRAEFERIQVDDDWIRRTIRETPVPAELARRVWERLGAGHVSESSPAKRSGGSGVSSAAETPSSKCLAEESFSKATGSISQPTAHQVLKMNDPCEKANQFSEMDYACRKSDVSRAPLDIGRIPASRTIPHFAARVLVATLVGCLAFCALWPLARIWNSSGRPYWGQDTLLQQAIMRFSADREVFGTGEMLVRSLPPGGLMPSERVVGIAESRWRRVTLGKGVPAIAYDLVGKGGTFATLYVAQVTIADLPPAPPPRPMLQTGMVSAAAWREGGRVMILVVAGGPEAYRGQFRVFQIPIA